MTDDRVGARLRDLWRGDHTVTHDELTNKILGELLTREGLKDAGFYSEDRSVGKRLWDDVKNETARAISDPAARDHNIALVEVAESMAEGSVALGTMLDHLCRVRELVNTSLDQAEAAATEAKQMIDAGHVVTFQVWPILRAMTRVAAGLRVANPPVEASLRACFERFYSAAKSLGVATEKDKRASLAEIVNTATAEADHVE